VEETSRIQDRFKGAEYMPLLNSLSITMVGQGGIGSPFALALSRAHPAAIFAYEYDIVEEHNLGGQIFSLSDVGEGKAEATQSRLEAYSDYYNFTPLGELLEDSEVTPTIFMCVDSNPARYLAFQTWKKMGETKGWTHEVELDDIKYIMPNVYFDGRLSFNQVEIYCVTEHTAAHHEATNLHLTNNNLTEGECTTKSNPEVGIVTGGLMFTWYRNFLQNVIDANILGVTAKTVPYKWTFNLSNGDINSYGKHANFPSQ